MRPTACLIVRISAIALYAVSASIAATAQTYPSKPIRFIVPFAPGGGTDVIARIIGQKLSKNLRQQLLVDNRAGAGGSIGSELAARSAPDGYTILMGFIGTLALNPSFYAKLPYDPVRDFAAVSQVARAQNILVVHPILPVKSVKDLLHLARTKPGQLNYASGGRGGAGHLAGELLRILGKVDIVHIAYKSAGPAMTDVIVGQVHFMITSMPAAAPHIKSGKLRAIAVTGARRSLLAPHLPTIAESGVPGYEFTNWWGVVAPSGTLGAVIGKLHEEIVKALRTSDLRERFAAIGAEPVGSTPEEFAAHIKAEIEKWAKIIRDAGIKAQ